MSGCIKGLALISYAASSSSTDDATFFVRYPALMIKRLLHEPLIHFFVIGAVLFILQSGWEDVSVANPNRIEISRIEIERLDYQFRKTWRREPSAEERAGYLKNHIDQEVLVREAIAIGLDKNDPVIRQRLEQKMRFLIEGETAALNPADEELQAYLKENETTYRRPPLVSFRQIMFAADTSQKELRSARDALRDGRRPDVPMSAPLLPEQIEHTTPSGVDGIFGAGFFGRIEALETGSWQGPIESTFGFHLVKISYRSEARLPELSEIRGEVISDWSRERSRDAVDEKIAQLRSRYNFVVPPGAGRGM